MVLTTDEAGNKVRGPNAWQQREQTDASSEAKDDAGVNAAGGNEMHSVLNSLGISLKQWSDIVEDVNALFSPSTVLNNDASQYEAEFIKFVVNIHNLSKSIPLTTTVTDMNTLMILLCKRVPDLIFSDNAEAIDMRQSFIDDDWLYFVSYERQDWIELVDKSDAIYLYSKIQALKPRYESQQRLQEPPLIPPVVLQGPQASFDMQQFAQVFAETFKQSQATFDMQQFAQIMAESTKHKNADSILKPKYDFNAVFVGRDEGEELFVRLIKWGEHVKQNKFPDDTMMFAINTMKDKAFEGDDLVRDKWEALTAAQRPKTFDDFLVWYREAANVRMEDMIARMMVWVTNTAPMIGSLERYVVDLRAKLDQLKDITGIDLSALGNKVDCIVSILLTKLPNTSVHNYRFRMEQAVEEVKRAKGDGYVVRLHDISRVLNDLCHEDSRRDDNRRQHNRNRGQGGFPKRSVHNHVVTTPSATQQGAFTAQDQQHRGQKHRSKSPASRATPATGANALPIQQPSGVARPGKAEVLNTMAKDPARRNAAYKPGGNELPFFPTWMLKVTCHKCGSIGHKFTWCSENPRRTPWTVEEAGVNAHECVALHATTQGSIEGANEIEHDAGVRMLMSLTGGSYDGADSVAMMAMDNGIKLPNKPPHWYEAELLGVKRIQPNFSSIMVDTGCTNCCVSAKALLHKIQKEKAVVEFLQWRKPSRVSMGNGQEQIKLGVRLVIRIPIFDEDGKPKGYFPMPVVANVAPRLPVDFLFGQSTALKYDFAPDDRMGRIWFTDARDDSRVFVKGVFTKGLSFVWPWLTYSNADSERFEADWLGAGRLDHDAGGVLEDWERVPWSPEAKLLRYDRTKGVPTLAGSYKSASSDSRPQDPFAFQAQDWQLHHTVPGRAVRPKVWRARGQVHVATSNRFEPLQQFEDSENW